jgi:hypothetical protein
MVGKSEVDKKPENYRQMSWHFNGVALIIGKG